MYFSKRTEKEGQEAMKGLGVRFICRLLLDLDIFEHETNHNIWCWYPESKVLI